MPHTATVTALSDHPARNEGDGMQRILAAALDLFAIHGFDQVSVNAIADKAGVSKANVFHHFKSKNDLYLATLREACRETRESLDVLSGTDGDIGERLTRYMREHLLAMLRNEQETRLVLREVLDNSPGKARALAEDVFKDRFEILVGVIRECQSKGLLRDGLDPAFVAVMLTGANVFYFQSREILRHFPGIDFATEPERYSEKFMDVLLNGIGVK